MDKFRAFRIDERDGKIVAGFEELGLDDLTEGNVTVRVTHSTINYKDALAATGKGKILRRYPLNGGIDFAGVVVSSEDEELLAGPLRAVVVAPRRVPRCGCCGPGRTTSWPRPWDRAWW